MESLETEGGGKGTFKVDRRRGGDGRQNDGKQMASLCSSLSTLKRRMNCVLYFLIILTQIRPPKWKGRFSSYFNVLSSSYMTESDKKGGSSLPLVPTILQTNYFYYQAINSTLIISIIMSEW